MALARGFAIGLVGIEGYVVEVEADLAQGLPGLSVIGLPDAALAEARDRVRSAVVNSKERWPNRRMTLALSPASLPKRGSGFDLVCAATILAADGALPAAALERRVLLGELGLDGRVRALPGVLPSALRAAEERFEEVVVPLANLAEARLVPGIRARGVGSLADLLALLRGEPYDETPPAPAVRDEAPALDLIDVSGQITGRTAIEVAAAGGHHALLLGPPGSGKTMLAQRMPGILPRLPRTHALEATAVHSVARTLPTAAPLIRTPPFEAPHHSATVASIVGGGSGIARPGAASLAHRGVLFLDEAPEFKAGVLDALRQPLEHGSLSIRRVGGTATYPAVFTLLLAANYCPCAKADRCTCPPDTRRRYLSRLSGPLMDRVDMHVEVPRITRAEMRAEHGVGEASSAVAARVRAARDLARRRYAGTPWRCNGDVPVVDLLRGWPLPGRATRPVDQAMDREQVTARGYGRVLRMAWTLADLQGVARPGPEHVGHALDWRLGSTLWQAAA